MNNAFLQKLFLYVPVKLIPALLGIFFIFFLYRYFPPGQYVSYSISLMCALVAAQLSSAWVGNSFIYFFSGRDTRGKSEFLSSCLLLVLFIAPLAASSAAAVAAFFVDEDCVFLLVGMLCFTQMFYFFLSSVCQACFMVKQQLVAVVIQATLQVLLILLFASWRGVEFSFALIALIVGYAFSSLYLLAVAVRHLGFLHPLRQWTLRRMTVISVYQYGAALSPWMLGMLVMLGADRFAVGYYEIVEGGGYLSLKDLFVGAGGLLSMPLLMLVHPLVIKRFREGSFAGKVIESSLGFLIVAFSLLWGMLAFVGFELFEWLTKKPVGVPLLIIFVSFVGVFVNSAAVYVQKRLEVHRKMKRLAYLAIGAAGISVGFSFLGGYFFGLAGVAVGVLLGQLFYFCVTAASMVKRMALLEGLGRPILVSILAFGTGYGLHLVIEIGMSQFDWWLRSLMWLSGFSLVSLIALWWGVNWREFMKSTIE